MKVITIVTRDVVHVPTQTAGLGETTNRLDVRVRPGLDLWADSIGVNAARCGRRTTIPWSNIAQVFWEPEPEPEPAVTGLRKTGAK